MSVMPISVPRWRQRMWAVLRGLIEWDSDERSVTLGDRTTLVAMSGMALAGMCAYFVLGGHTSTTILSGGEGQGGDEGVTTPVVDVIVQDTSTWIVILNAFASTAQGDTQDSLQIQVDRDGANFSSPLTNVVSATANVRDTISDNADWKADSTYVVRARRFSTILDVWSAYDSVTVVNTVVCSLVPDVESLPALSGQIIDTAAVHDSMRTTAAGDFYIEPTTGVRVIRLTDGSTPVSNNSANHDYSEAGPYVSGCWGDGNYTAQVTVNGVGRRLVDFDRDGVLSNWRSFASGADPDGETMSAFSSVTPQIIYVVDSQDSVHRINSATGTRAPAGNFPHLLSEDCDDFWFQGDATDTWFVCKASTSLVQVWNSQTNVDSVVNVGAGIDDVYMESNGRFVLASGVNRIIDLQTNKQYAAQTVGSLTSSSYAHVPALRRYFVAMNTDLGGGIMPLHMVDPDSSVFDHDSVRLDGYAPDSHWSGSWVQSDDYLDDDLTAQWVLQSQFNQTYQAGVTAPVAIDSVVVDGIGFHTIGGLQFQPTARTGRFLAHHHSELLGGTESTPLVAYYSQPHASINPDGHVVLFSSNMDTTRVDVWAVLVPLRAP